MTSCSLRTPSARTNAKDAETAREAADPLLERKPHLAPRTPTGDVGQGPRRKPAEVFDLVALLRERAEWYA